MIPILRSFKRHYHLVKGIASKMYLTGTFRLEMKFTPESSSVKNETPDEIETTRFVVLMRRFINPLDSIHYAKVWSFLRENFSTDIPAELIEKLEKYIEQMNKGYGEISFNGEVLTGEKIYHLIAESNYFAEDEEFLNHLKAITKVPMMGQLLWHYFYTYNESVFILATGLLGIIHDIEKSETYKNLIEESHKTKDLCIYCLSTSGDFTTEEHIFPEALGNDTLILPKGMVCKTCNNNLLSCLDNALVECPPISMLRVQYVPYTKKGKLPKAEFGDATIEKTKPRHIKITAKNGSNPFSEETKLEDGWVKYNFNFESKKIPDYNAIQRALYKIALGMVALEKSQDYASSDRFNVARDFILGRRENTPNRILLCKKVHPTPEGGAISYTDFIEGTFIAINIFGIKFFVNLEEKPLIEMSEELTQADFAYFPEE